MKNDVGYELHPLTSLTSIPHKPIIHNMLKTADPTIVPIPTSPCAIKTPIMDINNSGAELPAAMKVAPATSSLSFNFSHIFSKEATKYSSQTIAKAINI